MKKLIVITGILLFPLSLNAQFEQKVSFNISAGIFKSIGTKTYTPQWASSGDEYEPFQMPSYRPGVYINGAFQFNINRHLSLEASIGYMYSSSWFYDMYENTNYLYYSVYDTINDILLAEGENELNFSNLSVGLAPKYYLFPGKKFNPYLFVGININFTKAEYTDNNWQALKDLDMLDPDDTGPDNPFLEKNTGIGLNPGLGVEYSLNDKIGFFLSAGYYFILLDKSNFKTPEQVENFNSLFFQAGIRFSFLKSKEL